MDENGRTKSLVEAAANNTLLTIVARLAIAALVPVAAWVVSALLNLQSAVGDIRQDIAIIRTAVEWNIKRIDKLESKVDDLESPGR